MDAPGRALPARWHHPTVMWSSFEAGGGELRGWCSGTGDRLMLMLHGGPGLTEYTAELGLDDEIGQGLGSSWRIARFQQRGLAPSALDGAFTIEEAVADVASVIAHLGGGPAILAGHSWGSHLALHVAVARPDLVAGLLLIDGLAGVRDGGTSTMRKLILERIGPEAVARIAELATSDLSPVERETATFLTIWPGYFSQAALVRSPPDGLVAHPSVNGSLMGDARRLLAEEYLATRLPAVRVPSVHVIGTLSPVDPQAGIDTAALMSRADVQLSTAGTSRGSSARALLPRPPRSSRHWSAPLRRVEIALAARVETVEHSRLCTRIRA